MPHVPEPFTPGKHPLTEAIASIHKRVETFNAERLALASELEQVIQEARALLVALGQTASGGGRGRPAGAGRTRRSARKPGRPRGRTMSAEAREKIRQAQLKRWAKQKAGEKRK
jgi:hypothetical protein